MTDPPAASSATAAVPLAPALQGLAALVIANVVASTAAQDALFLSQHGRTHIPPAMLLGSLVTTAASLGLAALLRSGGFHLPRLLRGLLLLLAVVSASLFGWNLRPTPASTLALFLFVELSTTLAPAATWAYFQAPLGAQEARRLLPRLGTWAGVGGLCAGGVVPLLASAGPAALVGLSAGLWLGAAGLVRPGPTPALLRGRRALRAGGLRQLWTVPLLRWLVLATVLLIWTGLLVQLQTRLTLQRTQAPAQIAQTMGLLLALASVAGIFAQGVIATPVLERWGVGPALGILPAAVAGLLLLHLVVPALGLLLAGTFIDKTLRPNLHRPAEACLLAALPPSRRQPALLALSGVAAPVAKAVGALALVGLSGVSGTVLTGLALCTGGGLALLSLRWGTLYTSALRATLAEDSSGFAADALYIDSEPRWEAPRIDGPRLHLLLDRLDGGSARARALVLELLLPQRSAAVAAAMWARATHPQEAVRVAALRWLAEEPTPAVRALLRGRWRESTISERERIALLDAASMCDSAAVLLGSDPRPWIAGGGPALSRAVIRALLSSPLALHWDLGLAAVCAGLDAAEGDRRLVGLDLVEPALRPEGAGAAPRLAAAAAALQRPLLRCAADRDGRVRRAGLLLLPLLPDAGGDAGRQALFDALADPAVAHVAVRALGQMPSPPTVRALLDGLRPTATGAAQLQALKVLNLLRRRDRQLELDPVALHDFVLRDLRVGLQLRLVLDRLGARLRPAGLLRRELVHQIESAQERVARALVLLSPPDTMVHIFRALRNPGSPHRDQARELLRTLFRDLPSVQSGSAALFDPESPWPEGCFRAPLQIEPLRDEAAALEWLRRSRDPWLRAAVRHDRDVAPAAPAAPATPAEKIEDPMEHTLDTILFLKDVALFEELTNQQLVEVARLAEPVQVARGQVLFYQGDAPDYLYLVRHGKLRVLLSGQEVARLGRGECAGEMAFLSGAARTATVEAIDACELLRFESDDFLNLLSACPEIGRALLKSLVRRLAENTAAAGRPGARATITGMLDS